MYEDVKKAALKLNLLLERLVSVETDEALSMVRSKIGFLSNSANNDFETIHYKIHQEKMM